MLQAPFRSTGHPVASIEFSGAQQTAHGIDLLARRAVDAAQNCFRDTGDSISRVNGIALGPRQLAASAAGGRYIASTTGWIVGRSVKVKYVDLYSASLRIASNALPLPRKSALISASHTDSQASANTVRPRDTGWCITRYACLLPRPTPGTHSAWAGSG